MEKILPLIFLVGIALPIWGKSYPFKIRHSYNVQVVHYDLIGDIVAQKGNKFYKVWSEAGSVDKAIVQALQDAVAASLFTGVQASQSANSVPALCGSFEAYEKCREYFDKFFKKGEFLQYVTNVNSLYPSGENNVRTSKGHRVGLYVMVRYDALRKKLEQDGIIKGLNNYF